MRAHPAAAKPTEVAQQPFGLAVSGRYTYIADPVNHVVRLLIDNSEVPFAGNGSLAVAGDGTDPTKAQLAGPYAVAVGQVTQVGYQVTGFDVYIADTFGHQVRKATVTIPPIDSPSASQTAVITTIAGTGAFGFAGDGGAASAAKLNSPYGIAWDKTSNLVYVADTLNNRIRAIPGRRHDQDRGGLGGRRLHTEREERVEDGAQPSARPGHRRQGARVHRRYL